MRLLFRQGIVRYQTPTFLSIGGSYVSLVVNDIQCIITLADGTKDYLYVEQSSVSNAWGPITPATDQWLYWDIDRRTGIRTFGITLVEPVAQPSEPPSPATDQHWFDTSVKQMKVWNGVRWLDKIRVFACELSNGSVPISMSINSPAFDGTQAGLTTVDTFAGQILFDANTNQPLKTPDHKFITTEDRFATRTISFSDIKLSALVLSAEAQQNMSAYTIVKFTGFNEILYADAFTASQLGQFGIIEQDVLVGEFTNVVLEGVITNADWDWPTVNALLYSDATGTLVDVAPVPNAAPVAMVVGPQTIIFGSPKNTFNTYTVNVDLATAVDHGLVRLNIPPASALDPVVVGANDPRVTYLDNVTSDVQAQLNARALDAAVVHLAGTETITGAKTFTGGINAGADPITNVADPVALQDAATKFYVDQVAAAGSHWVAPIRDPDLNDIVSAQPTITSGAVGSTVTYIKYGGVQGESWTQGGASAVVDDGDVAIFTVTNVVGPVGDWIVVQQGPLATDDRFVVAGIHGTIGATLLGMGFSNNDLLQYDNLAAPGVITNAANWTTPSGAPPQDGTTTLVTDPDSPHYGVTYLYSAAGVEWFQIAGPGTTAIPLNEIVVGTGTDIGSDPDFTYNEANGTFYVNTIDGTTSSVTVGTPGSVGIVAAASSVSGTDGGMVVIASGNSVGTGDGGDIDIIGGVGAEGAGIVLTAGTSSTAPSGGAINLIGGGHSGIGAGGGVALIGGAPTDGAGGGIDLLAGAGMGTNDGGAITLQAGAAGPSGAGPTTGGAVTVQGGDGGLSLAFLHDGGSVNIVGGTVPSGGQGNGGGINITSGNGQFAGFAGASGNILVTTPDADDVGNNISGALVVKLGDNDYPGLQPVTAPTTDTAYSSSIHMEAGDATLSGSTPGRFYAASGGTSTIAASYLNLWSAASGNPITLKAGDGAATGQGIDVLAGVGTLFGGNITLTPGTGTLTDGVLNLALPSELQLNSNGGTSGQVLTSNGSGVAPTWQTPASAIEPSTQLVYGTGTGVDSSADFTFNDVSKRLTLNNGGGYQFILEAAVGLVSLWSTSADLRLTGGAPFSTSLNAIEIANNVSGVTIYCWDSSSLGAPNGGPFTVLAGDSYQISGSTTGGAVSMTAGRGSPTGVGGAVTITGGQGGTTSGNGGAITIQGGSATGSTGGTVTLRGGTSTVNGHIVFDSSYTEKASAPAISVGTLTLNMNNGNHFNVSLNANITTLTISNVPTTASSAIGLTIVFTADGTGRTITWPASFKWAGGTAPTMTSTLNKIDVVTATSYDNGTSWLATATQNF